MARENELVQILAAQVGKDRYERAREKAWRTAADVGRIDRGTSPLGKASEDDAAEMVPHELADWIWYDANLEIGERLDFGLALYGDMPSYANQMYVSMFFPKFENDVRTRFWDAYRAFLDDPDDRLAMPVAYSLWVDYFEDPERAAEAWHEMSRPQISERTLQRLVPMSGPVPWELKAPLYEQLAADPQLHPLLLRGLSASESDLYGKIVAAEAARLLRRLQLPPETPGLGELKARLAKAT